jgi:hypothetical protein
VEHDDACFAFRFNAEAGHASRGGRQNHERLKNRPSVNRTCDRRAQRHRATERAPLRHSGGALRCVEAQANSVSEHRLFLPRRSTVGRRQTPAAAAVARARAPRRVARRPGCGRSTLRHRRTTGTCMVLRTCGRRSPTPFMGRRRSTSSTSSSPKAGDTASVPHTDTPMR